MRLLLINTGRSVARAIRGILLRTAVEVLEARDAREVEKCLGAAGLPDLAFFRREPARPGGFEVVRSIRSCRRLDGMRLVLLTGALDPSEILEAVRLGVDHCLVLPVTKRELFLKFSALRLSVG